MDEKVRQVVLQLLQANRVIPKSEFFHVEPVENGTKKPQFHSDSEESEVSDIEYMTEEQIEIGNTHDDAQLMRIQSLLKIGGKEQVYEL